MNQGRSAPVVEIPGALKGLIVVSVPKCGTNFLSRYLSHLTGWPHRWGRPSRDSLKLQDDLPVEPDPDVDRRAVHLIHTARDILRIPEKERPAVFGNRKLAAARPENPAEAASSSKHWVLAEHPLHSLAYFLRNPKQVPLVGPAEVVAEAERLGYSVLFLSRNIRDIVNSLAHFLHAGTRYVQFRTLNESFEVCVQEYAPVLAQAIRLWRREFAGTQIAYEALAENTRDELHKICRGLGLVVAPDQLVSSTAEFRTFTFRKGGTADWKNYLSDRHSRELEEKYPDLI